MKNDMMYWTMIGIAFVATLIVGTVMMKKTGKFGRSFWISSAINIAVHAIAVVWFVLTNGDPTRQNFGIIVFVIACVNLLIIDAFVLFSMRNSGNAEAVRVYEPIEDDEDDYARKPKRGKARS